MANKKTFINPLTRSSEGELHVPKPASEGIHTNRDKLSSIAYSEELISCTISATLQSTDQHHGIVGQKCCHYQLDS